MHLHATGVTRPTKQISIYAILDTQVCLIYVGQACQIYATDRITVDRSEIYPEHGNRSFNLPIYQSVGQQSLRAAFADQSSSPPPPQPQFFPVPVAAAVVASLNQPLSAKTSLHQPYRPQSASISLNQPHQPLSFSSVSSASVGLNQLQSASISFNQPQSALVSLNQPPSKLDHS